MAILCNFKSKSNEYSQGSFLDYHTTKNGILFNNIIANPITTFHNPEYHQKKSKTIIVAKFFLFYQSTSQN